MNGTGKGEGWKGLSQKNGERKGEGKMDRRRPGRGGGRRFTKGERKGEGICRKSGGKTLHNLTIKV